HDPRDLGRNGVRKRVLCLHECVPSAYASNMRSGERSMRGLVGKLRDVLTELATFNPTKQSDDDVHAVLPELLTAINQLDAVTAITLASFDTRQLAERDGFQATRTWLTAYGRLSQGAASGLLTRGRTLRQLPALAADAGAG